MHVGNKDADYPHVQHTVLGFCPSRSRPDVFMWSIMVPRMSAFSWLSIAVDSVIDSDKVVLSLG